MRGRQFAFPLNFSIHFLCRFRISFYLCQRSEKDSLQQKKRYARIANENVRNFQDRNAIGHNGLYVICVGLLPNFISEVILTTFIRNWHKQSRASAMAENEQ